MLPTMLALGSAISWGAADFLGGLKNRTLGLLAVMVPSQLAGLLIAGAALVALGNATPAHEVVRYGLLAGVAYAAGLGAFYRALALGHMSIVSPIVGMSAALPVVVGLIRGERPELVAAVGIGVALVGIVLASRKHGIVGGSGAGATIVILLAVVAAAGIGGNLVLLETAISDAPRSAVLWAPLFSRVAILAILVALATTRRAPVLPSSSVELGPLAALGVLDLLANILYGLSVRESLLVLSAVLASLHPVVTVLLARRVLGELLSAAQALGVCLALGGICLIAVGSV